MVEDVEAIYKMGFSLIGVVIIMILFNLAIIIINAVHLLQAVYRRRQMKKRWDAEIERIEKIKTKFNNIKI